MSLQRDSSCCRDLLWNLSHGLDSADIVARCQALGFDGANHRDRLWIFSTERLSQVVIVVQTGRVQLRLSPVIPQDERVAAAEALAARLR